MDLRCTTSTSSGTDGARHSIFGSTSEAKAVTVRQPSWKTIRAEEHEPLTYPVARSVELKPTSRALSIVESRKIDIGFSRKFDRLARDLMPELRHGPIAVFRLMFFSDNSEYPLKMRSDTLAFGQGPRAKEPLAFFGKPLAPAPVPGVLPSLQYSISHSSQK